MWFSVMHLWRDLCEFVWLNKGLLYRQVRVDVRTELVITRGCIWRFNSQKENSMNFSVVLTLYYWHIFVMLFPFEKVFRSDTSLLYYYNTISWMSNKFQIKSSNKILIESINFWEGMSKYVNKLCPLYVIQSLLN